MMLVKFKKGQSGTRLFIKIVGGTQMAVMNIKIIVVYFMISTPLSAVALIGIQILLRKKNINDSIYYPKIAVFSVSLTNRE